jgi:2-keto-3-deoxy-L-rhamnonate aldolase RhmA
MSYRDSRRTVREEDGAMQFLMIVDDPGIARHVSRNGVARLFVDLEHIGKDARQKNLDTWKSRQIPADVTKIREAAPDAHLLVRINPLHEGTAAELDDVLARGADSIMLPMFRSLEELARFFDLLNGRAEALPLVETAAALNCIPRIVNELPVTGLHIGLNDLHLDLGLDFMFQPLGDGLLEEAAAALRTSEVRFGIGGIARAREGIVSPEFLLGEHVRLGSTGAILSRTFHRGAKTVEELCEQVDFALELAKLQSIYTRFRRADAASLERNRIETADRINDVVRLVKLRGQD